MNTPLVTPGPDDVLERAQAIDFLVRRIAPELYLKARKEPLWDEKSRVRKRIDYACETGSLVEDARKRIRFRDLVDFARTIPEWEPAMRDLPVHATVAVAGASAALGAGSTVVGVVPSTTKEKDQALLTLIRQEAELKRIIEAKDAEIQAKDTEIARLKSFELKDQKIRATRRESALRRRRSKLMS